MTLAFAKKVTGTWPYDRILTLYKDLDGKANDFMTEVFVSIISPLMEHACDDIGNVANITHHLDAWRSMDM